MKLNRRIITAMAVICMLFLAIVLYLTIFTVFQAKTYVESGHNTRIEAKEEKILRGTIYDRSGTVLAKSTVEDGIQTRVYPYGKIYAHTIGYCHKTYGKTNLEKTFNKYLIKTESIIDILVRGIEEGEENEKEELIKGANLNLTIDHELTKFASQQLGDSKGSVIVLNPTTGETYCLYSNPSFDPNQDKLEADWELLNNDTENAPFNARATRGVYEPGSTFKIITAAAAIEENLEDYTLKDSGKINIGGREIVNSGNNAYGNINMKRAFAKSSNVYFASLSEKIGKKKLEEVTGRFYLDKKIPYDIATTDVSTLETRHNFSSMDAAELAWAAVGQEKLRVTPLHMALAACAVANNGVIMKPYIVESAYFNEGRTIYNAKTEVLSAATDEYVTKLLDEFMRECVKAGTGTAARMRNITVAGKTGSAENDRAGQDHAWFVGYAPADNPQIAICVMKEYSGAGGGAACAPIARRIISFAAENGLIK